MTETKRLSIVIPARNEARRLPACIAALRTSAGEANVEIEVIVVNNRSTDETAAIARSLGCRVIDDDAKNLSHIRNTGVRAAVNEFILTVDADSLVSVRLIGQAMTALARAEVAGGGVLILPERWSLGIAATGMLVGFIAVVCGISGGAFFFRREAFEAIGGFDETMLSAEDIDFARRLKRYARARGGSFRNLLTAWIVTSCRKFDTFGDWYLVLRPWLAWRLLRGRDRRLADRVWYDYRE